MSRLTQLLEAVKTKNLSKAQLEDYHADLIHLYSAVLIERSDLRKKEAFYFAEKMRDGASDVSIKRMFRVTDDGQRLLELEAFKAILPKEIDSIKTRIYALL